MKPRRIAPVHVTTEQTPKKKKVFGGFSFGPPQPPKPQSNFALSKPKQKRPKSKAKCGPNTVRVKAHCRKLTPKQIGKKPFWDQFKKPKKKTPKKALANTLQEDLDLIKGRQTKRWRDTISSITERYKSGNDDYSDVF